MPPFEFFTWVLGADGGRRRLLARLGPEAAEPIEAFLAQTLAYEQGHPSTLQGFLHWLSLGSDELKRDPEQARDVVRVVTVHGAKGLEAPIVFLADAGPRQASRRGRLHWSLPEADGTTTALPFWRAGCRRARRPCAKAIEARDAASELEERRRLLYVALTRARDRLYVTGWLPRGGEPATRRAVLARAGPACARVAAGRDAPRLAPPSAVCRARCCAWSAADAAITAAAPQPSTQLTAAPCRTWLASTGATWRRLRSEVGRRHSATRKCRKAMRRCRPLRSGVA